MDALLGTALLELNNDDKEVQQHGLHRLEAAYKLDAQNAMVLNLLANHFFQRWRTSEDLDTVRSLAMAAFHRTASDEIRGESCYHLARTFHVQDDYEQAFQYYYQASKLVPEFSLAQFGLGQMYIHKGDLSLAMSSFEKVLAVEPDNYESLKVLGSLYRNVASKKAKAVEYLTKVTEQTPDDLEAWIELGELQESVDPVAALKAYETAARILTDQVGVTVPPELVANMGVLSYMSGDYAEAERRFREALSACEGLGAASEETGHLLPMAVTVRYDLARTLEALRKTREAEGLYRQILKEHPNYVDCYLRLGCIEFARGHVFEASDLFKDALGVREDLPDAWSLLASIHLSKNELRPGRKKIERILTHSNKHDAYALVALGNVYCMTAKHEQNKDVANSLYKKALEFYQKVLNLHSKNIYGAHGIGVVLAEKGLYNQAKEVFLQVREAASDYPDVLTNLAHVYVEMGQCANAIRMVRASWFGLFDQA